MNLGRSIKLLRRKRGLTQKELAGLAGMSSQSLHQIEIGLNWPRLQTLEALSGVLGESIAYIMFHSIEESDLGGGVNGFRDMVRDVFAVYLKRPEPLGECGVNLDHLKDLQACTAAGDRWSSSDLVSGIPGESNLSVVRYDDNGDVVKSDL